MVITAVIPSIIRMFKILLPTTFPTVIPAFCCMAAVTLTAASGILVPMATIVSPITSWGIPSFFAIHAAPSTNQSAPFTRNRKPASKIITCHNIIRTSLSLVSVTAGEMDKKRNSYCSYSKSLAIPSLSELSVITVLTKK